MNSLHSFHFISLHLCVSWSRTCQSTCFAWSLYVHVWVYDRCISRLTADIINNLIVFLLHICFACRQRWTRHSSRCTTSATPPSPSWPSASLTRTSSPSSPLRSATPPALFFINTWQKFVWLYFYALSQHPKLYQPGQLSLFFNYKEFAVSAVQGFLTSMLLFLLPMGEYTLQWSVDSFADFIEASNWRSTK